MKYIKEGTEFLDHLKDSVHDLSDDNKELRKEIERLSKKSEILEENNKLLIQQKSQLYEDLDIAYKRIDEAIEYIKENETSFSVHEVANAFGIPSLEFTLEPWKKDLLNILQGVDKE